MGIAIALQTKIYQLLSGDSTLTDMAGVYDHTPDNTETPYVQIGEDTLDDFGSIDISGFKVIVEIHTWVQSQGRKTCKEIQDRVYDLLHNTDLALTGQKTVSLRGGMCDTKLDPDGRTYHGINRFNLILGG